MNLKRPGDVVATIERRFENQHCQWLAGHGSWPLTVGLGAPGSSEHPAEVRQWVDAWSSWPGPGTVAWRTRRWANMGEQRFPESFSLAEAAQAAAVVGQSERWHRATRRYGALVQRWPQFSQSAVLAGRYDTLADYPEADFERLFELLRWLEANPQGGVFLRQLPVVGLDTKWIGERKGLVLALLRVIRGVPEVDDLYTLCGLRRSPSRMRLRILCPALRASTGGLCDLEAPVGEFAALQLAPETCLIVENLETGLALPQAPGVVAIIKLGNAVSLLGELRWLAGAQAVYWGDIDSHGYAILDRARAVLPHLESVLMDETTLRDHLALAVREPQPAPEAPLPHLTEAERRVLDGLRSNSWGVQLRLEQERIGWAHAMGRLAEAIAGFQAGVHSRLPLR
jgi:hypothetical protein